MNCEVDAFDYNLLGLDRLTSAKQGRTMETPKERKAVKYSREDTAFHFDAGKAPLEQLPTGPLEDIAQVFAYGAEKYGPYNWLVHEEAWDWTQLCGSLLRHVFAWIRKEDVDPESGHTHLAHAVANGMMLMQLIERGSGRDDRPPQKETR